MSADPLIRVRRAAAAKRRAELEYRSSIVDAVDTFALPFPLVADAAGISRQAVRVLVLRERARKGVK